MKYIYTLSIDGMRCGMCESHINDQIRKNFDAVKVKSNRHKKQTIIVSSKELDVDKIERVIKDTGYYYNGLRVDTK